MNIILIPPADKELDEAIDYYNDQLAGLGEQFYRSFLDTVGYISQTPDTWRKIGANTRSTYRGQTPLFSWTGQRGVC